MNETQNPARPALWKTLLKIGGLVLGVPLGLVLLAFMLILVGANTGMGRHEIERRLPGLTGGSVRMTGLSGRFPDSLRIAHLELNDYRGTWLAIDDLALDWSPTRLLLRRAVVDDISIARLSIPRLSEEDPAHPSPPSRDSSDNVHMGVDIRHAHIARIDVGAPLARLPATFSLDGHARLADIAPVLNGISVATLPAADINLQVQRLDQPGTVSVRTQLGRGTLALDVHAHEEKNGFLGTLSGLPMLAPLNLDMHVSGPRDQSMLAVAIQAGAAQAHIDGRVGLVHHAMQLRASLEAPAMMLGPDTGWQSIALRSELGGTMERPTGHGTLDIGQLNQGGAGLNTLHAVFSGLSGRSANDAINIHADIDGLRIPGAHPTLFAAQPVAIDVSWRPDAQGAPADITVHHDLLQVNGHIRTTAPRQGDVTLDLPRLAPFAALASTRLEGNTHLHANFDIPDARTAGRVALDGQVAITGGQAQAVGLIGRAGHVQLGASMPPADGSPRIVHVQDLKVDGQTLHLDAGDATVTLSSPTQVDMTARLELLDLQKLAPSLRGQTSVTLTAKGAVDDLAATVHAQTQIGTPQIQPGQLMTDLNFRHLPAVREGEATIKGTLDRAPVALAASLVTGTDGTRHLRLGQLSWKSLSGQADMALPHGHMVPSGTMDIHMTRLADWRDLLGHDITGHVAAGIHTTARIGATPPVVSLNLDGAIGSPWANIRRLQLGGTIRDPVDAPHTDLDLKIDDADVNDIHANAHVTARGPLNALLVSATSRLSTPQVGPAALDTVLLLDIAGHKATARTLTAEARGERLQLLAPATVSYGTAMGVEHVRATLTPPQGQAASIDIAGSLRPGLDLKADLTHITPALLRPLMPSLRAEGDISAQARLTGTLARPGGRITIRADGLKYHTDYTSSLAAANLDATAVLNGTVARVDASLNAGKQVSLNVQGNAPTGLNGALSLHAAGSIDLAAANAYLGAQARQAGGVVRMNVDVRGTPKVPLVSGTLDLADGTFHDYAQGVQLSAIRGSVLAQGNRLVIQSLSAGAGKGTITAAGSYGIFEPGHPIDLTVTARNARPLASDLITATLDANLNIKGQLASRINAGGDITLSRVDVNIPDSLPTSVAHLDVIRPEDAATVAQQPTSPLVIGLDLGLRSPGQFFVRGHGLNTEMHGNLHLGGTSDTPIVTGSFSMAKGTFALGGISLNFSKGKVGFDGIGVTHAIDPSLDFVAERSTNEGTARLNVGGYASAPKITFSSTPPLSQDQILAILLFGTDSQSLSPTQMAEIASAIATISGGSAFDPLGIVRKTLHLDRLQMSSSSNGSGGNDTGSIEAGKYVMRGVYVGAKQATSGSGTQAQVQVDLTKRLKINTTVGTGGNVTGFTTPENDPGSSIGLLYQFNY
ncbi:translocation/assembly module TamB domain-containing protein [Novacetimonas hansenii]|uniref:translocation/assembly module TamB domain-containing protein n=1 Tax=Novacetimonas hansenii TaxID=436 RepID=UPI00177EE3AF|nr:translocation/assembly module TamB domain-containing protein [Novacetimonas hansenii]QOF96325.1 translocation/assembly module TamB domain-containing protein [Novacetimonas hansenii]